VRAALTVLQGDIVEEWGATAPGARGTYGQLLAAAGFEAIRLYIDRHVMSRTGEPTARRLKARVVAVERGAKRNGSVNQGTLERLMVEICQYGGGDRLVCTVFSDTPGESTTDCIGKSKSAHVLLYALEDFKPGELNCMQSPLSGACFYDKVKGSTTLHAVIQSHPCSDSHAATFRGQGHSTSIVFGCDTSGAHGYDTRLLPGFIARLTASGALYDVLGDVAKLKSATVAISTTADGALKVSSNRIQLYSAVSNDGVAPDATPALRRLILGDFEDFEGRDVASITQLWTDVRTTFENDGACARLFVLHCAIAPAPNCFQLLRTIVESQPGRQVWPKVARRACTWTTRFAAPPSNVVGTSTAYRSQRASAENHTTT
jgi:hypothetical protein